MTFQEMFTSVRSKILDNDCDAAELELARLKPMNRLESRILGHAEGLLFFHRGNILEAKERMERTLNEFGENVNLLSDLMFCQYHLQDMAAFRQNLFRLEQLLVEHETHLSLRSLFDCEIQLGKFLEEEARLHPSREVFERALIHAEQPLQKLSALIQISRWQAFYEPSPELSRHYRELISFPLTKLNHDMRVELEHTLMLIELRLIGADHAWQRIERLGDALSPIDHRLLYFDYIEGCMSLDLPVSDRVKDKIKEFKNLDPFEDFLSRLVNGAVAGTGKLQALTLLAPRVLWASYLKLLCLAANFEGNASIRQELHRKLQLILRALDPKSQALWNRRLKEAMEAPEIRMEYSARNRAVWLQGRHVDLSKKKMGIQLIEALTLKNEISIDEAIDLLWQSSFTPEHYHRLRMGIHRLNGLLNKSTGLGKIIEVDSQSVRLRPEVRIRAGDESMHAVNQSL